VCDGFYNVLSHQTDAMGRGRGKGSMAKEEKAVRTSLDLTDSILLGSQRPDCEGEHERTWVQEKKRGGRREKGTRTHRQLGTFFACMAPE